MGLSRHKKPYVIKYVCTAADVVKAAGEDATDQAAKDEAQQLVFNTMMTPKDFQ
jgi:hypothetical protein